MEDYNKKDFLHIYFSNDDATYIECLEAIIRSVSLGKDYIRRTNNQELIIEINSSDLNYNYFATFLVNYAHLEDLGYNNFDHKNLKKGSITQQQQKRLLTESDELDKYAKKLYECQNYEYLKWDEYFLASAMLASMRSKDPSTSVGCCIVNQDNIKLSEGYNGTPVGWKDEEFPWQREGDFLNTKYAYVVHSEANAITHCIGQGISLHGSRIYVTLFPCNECLN